MPNSRVVRAEWLKLKNYAPFWVLFGCYFLTVFGVIAIALMIHYKAVHDSTGAAVLATHPIFNFPVAWQTVAYIASWLQFIPATLIILNVTNEFTYRTHRQNILDGWSRSQFVGAKFAAVAGLTLFATLLVGALTLVAAGCNGFAPSPDGLDYLGGFAVQTLVYGMFALAAAVFIRRAALALAAFLVYSTVLEGIMAIVMSYKVKQLAFVLPFRVANTLVPFPYYRQSTQSFLATPSEPVLVAISLVYVVLFAGAVWLRFTREDL